MFSEGREAPHSRQLILGVFLNSITEKFPRGEGEYPPSEMASTRGAAHHRASLELGVELGAVEIKLVIAALRNHAMDSTFWLECLKLPEKQNTLS